MCQTCMRVPADTCLLTPGYINSEANASTEHETMHIKTDTHCLKIDPADQFGQCSQKLQKRMVMLKSSLSPITSHTPSSHMNYTISMDISCEPARGQSQRQPKQ
ncbi:hypothetical protein N7G274_000692 [Stereocaulon virgatum]|uniref:Uncharacterized protein n=1 Tax=Stereocaulon virgatum TaxID=373712 RepID=A0ABR4AQ97_9LECA